MKKILIITFYFPPDNNGGTERVKQFYNRLNNEHFETYVLSRKKLNFKKKNSQFNSANVLRTWFPWIWIGLYNRFLRKFQIRIPLFYWFAKKSIKHIKKKINPDICIASFPLINNFQIGLLMKEECSIKLVSDFRDGLMYAPFENVFINKEYEKEMYILERKVANKSDLIIGAVPQITDYIKNTYKVNAHTIWNGFDDEEKFEDITEGFPKDSLNILYTGALGQSDIQRFIYAKECLGQIFLQNKKSRFYFIGAYTKEERDFFMNFNNVYVYPVVTRNQAVVIQRKADVLLLVTRDEECGTSGKLFEYLFSGKPILNLGGMNNARKIIEETNAGISFFSTEIEKINAFLQTISKNDNRFKRKNLEQYTRREECNKLTKHLLDMYR